MAVDLINASDTDVTGWGGSAVNVSKRTISASAAPTDAQAVAGLTAVSGDAAVLKGGASAQNKARVAGMLLDSVLTSVDLSTPLKRKAFKLKKGLSELEEICAQLGL